MICPYCGFEESKVLDSRPGSEGQTIRRRRECVKCTKRWKTLERIDIDLPLVTKRNNSFEPFDREKLKNAMMVSCGKRPVAVAQIEKVIADIEWNLVQSGAEEVTTTQLGESVMKALKAIDEIAYIRYASVYKRFRDVEELFSGMRDLLEETRTADAEDSKAPESNP